MNEIRRQIPGVVDALVGTYDRHGGTSHNLSGRPLPDRQVVAVLLDDLLEVLYPGYYGPREMTEDNVRYYVGERVDRIAFRLRRELYRALHHRCIKSEGNCDICHAGADRIVLAFLGKLAELRRVLARDVRAGFEGDPAATGLDEVIFCYPGLYAITVYRIANIIHAAGGLLIPRMMTELAHSRTGVDIHPGAAIGESFFIDHGTGVVIGETTVIGERVRLYQGVTLGALSLSASEAETLRGKKRHPTIEDDVVIYANATILGGQTIIGKGAVLGGNVWITKSVAPGSKVTL